MKTSDNALCNISKNTRLNKNGGGCFTACPLQSDTYAIRCIIHLYISLNSGSLISGHLWKHFSGLATPISKF